LLFGGVGPEEEGYALPGLGRITVEEQVSQQGPKARHVQGRCRLLSEKDPEITE
jgi:hypothetical protein